MEEAPHAHYTQAVKHFLEEYNAQERTKHIFNKETNSKETFNLVATEQDIIEWMCNYEDWIYEVEYLMKGVSNECAPYIKIDYEHLLLDGFPTSHPSHLEYFVIVGGDRWPGITNSDI